MFQYWKKTLKYEGFISNGPSETNYRIILSTNYRCVDPTAFQSAFLFCISWWPSQPPLDQKSIAFYSRLSEYKIFCCFCKATCQVVFILDCLQSKHVLLFLLNQYSPYSCACLLHSSQWWTSWDELHYFFFFLSSSFSTSLSCGFGLPGVIFQASNPHLQDRITQLIVVRCFTCHQHVLVALHVTQRMRSLYAGNHTVRRIAIMPIHKQNEFMECL